MSSATYKYCTVIATGQFYDERKQHMFKRPFAFKTTIYGDVSTELPGPNPKTAREAIQRGKDWIDENI